MARRRKRTGSVVSLFPFLSILACVIGVLTLLITAMALGQLDEEAIRNARIEIYERSDRDRVYEQLLDGIQSTEEKVVETRRKIAEAMSLKKKLDAARAELKQLRRNVIAKKVPDKDPQAVKLLADSHMLRDRISELNRDLVNFTQLIEQMRAELNRRRSPPEAAIVKIRGGGSGDVDEIKQVPTFIECTASNVIVYHNVDRRTRIRRSSLAGSDTFIKVLRAVRDTDNGIAVFLVREDGVRTYFIARSVARTEYCPHGKLPVMGQGKLDLSAFDDIIREQAIPLEFNDADGDGVPDDPPGNGTTKAPS